MSGDPVTLLAGTLAGLAAKEQATVLQRAMRAYVRICYDAYPNMPLEEIAWQFAAIAKAATARLAEMNVAASAARTQ